jgi:hypothetical protein
MDKTVNEGQRTASKNAQVPKPLEPDNSKPKKPEHCPLCGKEQRDNNLCHLFDGV